MSVHVFLGPTLERSRAQELVDATFWPPARMGDVIAVLEHRPTAIAIIDGYFEYTPAVWHKEILYAISQGVKVFGASSMGALRAAELHAFGMQGVGEIFEAYASGALEDDDEVAVVHAPPEHGFRGLSDAMVNIRNGLRIAITRGIITAKTESALLAAAKQTFYAERSWNGLLGWAKTQRLPEAEVCALEELLETEKPDLKRADAVLLLKTLASSPAVGSSSARDRFDFEPTAFWEHAKSMYSPLQHGAASTGATEHLRNHVKVFDPEREEVMRTALLLFFVSKDARQFGREAPDLKTAVRNFRRRRGLETASQLQAWLERERVSDTELFELAKLEHALVNLQMLYAHHADRYLPSALKLAGKFGDAAQAASEKRRFLSEKGISNPSFDDAMIGANELLRWYQLKCGRIATSLEEHIAQVGVSADQFRMELLAEYLFRQLSVEGEHQTQPGAGV